MHIGRKLSAALGLLALLPLAPAPARAAGFGIFEQGAKATGMGGAFTAQADDSSALWYNAGGLAFVDHQRWSLGTTYITFSKADFHGANPFPGDDVSAKQTKLTEFPPNLYWTRPINENWKFGLGIESPFGLKTEWQNPATFAGRFLSTRASLQAVDLNPTIGWKLSPTMGLGVGAIFRFSNIDLRRYVEQIDPFTFAPADIARVGLKSNTNTGFGWNLGFLDKVNNSFSWGLSYRSKVTVDYDGHGTFTQISTGDPVFDALVAAQIPFHQQLPIKSKIEFPDMASLGVAIMLTANSGLEVDANWTGWSSFDQVPVTFTDNPEFSSTLPENWKNVWNYRLGYHFDSDPQNQWRLGFIYDKTPQPEDRMSPLLPDADRYGYSIGWGHHFQGAKTLDLALTYLPFKKRSTLNNADGFDGTYQTTAWLFGANFTF